MKKLLTGNEAVARGAFEAGVKFACAYPGTPSTEILENVALYEEHIKAEWAPNEKVALESSIGASIAGARSLAAMKHVGVNVAADPLFTYAYMGVNGGLVLVSADDPGMHSSQNEQDNRYYAKFAKMALLEPSDSQESKDMIKEAYKISEEFDVPVLFRMTTRVCHSKSIVEFGERQEAGIREYVKKPEKFLAKPAHSRALHVILEEKLKKLEKFSNETELNFVEDNGSKIGVISSGVAYKYAKEIFKDDASYLKLGFTNPLPIDKIRDFAGRVDKLYVIEELEPYMEEQIKAAGIECFGKEYISNIGELNPDIIEKSIFEKEKELLDYDRTKTVPRPPTLCAGCPHRGFFYELAKKKDLVVSGDIGCYTLGSAAPLNALDTVICMGASISAGHGIQQVLDMGDSKKRAVAVIGDSTFFHTGINSLLNVVYNKSNTISVILDNRITGMTGHQENPGTGYTLQGQEVVPVDIEKIVRALGIENVKTVNPIDLKEMKDAIDWAMAIEDKPSVIITRWPCVLKRLSKEDYDEFGHYKHLCEVEKDKCIGCRKCIKTGCPALSFDKDTKKVSIDNAQCVGCEVCLQVCPVNAIKRMGE